jgi:hypothetical protein
LETVDKEVGQGGQEVEVVAVVVAKVVAQAHDSSSQIEVSSLSFDAES